MWQWGRYDKCRCGSRGERGLWVGGGEEAEESV